MAAVRLGQADAHSGPSPQDLLAQASAYMSKVEPSA